MSYFQSLVVGLFFKYLFFAVSYFNIFRWRVYSSNEARYTYDQWLSSLRKENTPFNKDL
jgi:hypothetical protein